MRVDEGIDARAEAEEGAEGKTEILAGLEADLCLCSRMLCVALRLASASEVSWARAAFARKLATWRKKRG